MYAVASQDLTIALAIRENTLRLVERASRFAGETFISIEDACGIIEVALTWEEADGRVAAVKERVRG
jgi:hypothetical protein